MTLHLPRTAAAWGSAGFDATLKTELEALGAQALPLRPLLRHGSAVLDTPLY